MTQYFQETFNIAIAAIRANKLRSGLTALGIIIGVMTVIAMTSLIQGMNKSVATAIEAIGTNSFMIRKFPAMITSGEDWRRYNRRKDLTQADAEAIAELCPAVNVAVPQMYAYKRVRYKGEESSFVPIGGYTHEYENISTIDITYGRFFTAADEEHKTHVCVLGPDVVKRVFPNRSDILGEYIYIAGWRFTVIGMTEARGSMMGESMDNYVLIPFSTFKKRFGTRRELDISVQAINAESIEKAKEQVIQILRIRRGLTVDEENDFEVMTQETMMETYNSITKVVFIVMVGIASISLVVGGIGIMNIMLVSVTERTKEIGIRKAIGAKRRDILWQFLVEATLLSLFGGVIGIAIGVGIAWAISKFTPIPAAAPLWSILVGTSICVAVGLFFGIFPAAKASKLHPIDALRYE